MAPQAMIEYHKARVLQEADGWSLAVTGHQLLCWSLDFVSWVTGSQETWALM